MSYKTAPPPDHLVITNLYELMWGQRPKDRVLPPDTKPGHLSKTYDKRLDTLLIDCFNDCNMGWCEIESVLETEMLLLQRRCRQLETEGRLVWTRRDTMREAVANRYLSGRYFDWPALDPLLIKAAQNPALQWADIADIIGTSKTTVKKRARHLEGEGKLVWVDRRKLSRGRGRR